MNTDWIIEQITSKRATTNQTEDVFVHFAYLFHSRSRNAMNTCTFKSRFWRVLSRLATFVQTFSFILRFYCSWTTGLACAVCALRWIVHYFSLPQTAGESKCSKCAAMSDAIQQSTPFYVTWTVVFWESTETKRTFSEEWVQCLSPFACFCRRSTSFMCNLARISFLLYREMAENQLSTANNSLTSFVGHDFE